MEVINYLIDFVLHIDKHLGELIIQYGVWSYLILFAVIFAETGFVFTPFLPGDSLLFAAGTFAAIGAFNIGVLFCVIASASICGDNVNYAVGNFIGPKIFEKDKIRFLKKEYLTRTHEFYEKHGAKTIILGKFIPIIRTFAPFVAGIGKMTYRKFFIVNISAAIVWVSLFTFLGYFFGNLPFVRNNFSFAIFGIIFISILPGLIEYIRHKYFNKDNVNA